MAFLKMLAPQALSELVFTGASFGQSGSSGLLATMLGLEGVWKVS